MDPNSRARRPAEQCRSPYLLAGGSTVNSGSSGEMVPFGLRHGAGVEITYQTNNNNLDESQNKTRRVTMDLASDEELFV